MSAQRERRESNLKAAAAQKSADAEAKARRSIMVLTARGALIDFRAVAAEAGVSPSFLYKHPALRAEIVRLRKPPPARLEPRSPAVRSKDASNAVKLAVAAAALRELRRENEALRDENARLRGDLHAARRAPRHGPESRF